MVYIKHQWNFLSARPKRAARVTPVALAARSIQSPLRLPPVQYSWSSSIHPLIKMGIAHAQRVSLNLSHCHLWHRRYSIQSVPHVPPYIATCTHLSMNATSLSSVFGGVKNDRYHITTKEQTDIGYLLIIFPNLAVFFLIIRVYMY